METTNKIPTPQEYQAKLIALQKEQKLLLKKRDKVSRLRKYAITDEFYATKNEWRKNYPQ